MKRAIAALLLSATLAAGPAAAQETVWVQVEAHRTLSGATDTARDYSGDLENVSGFAIGGGWYGIALGPYTPDDALDVLLDLRRSGQIPSDAYIVDGSAYRQQFWPVGISAATTLQQPPADAPGEDDGQQMIIDTAQEGVDTLDIAPETDPVPEPDPVQIPDETPAEARASEAELTRPEREDLQIALQWAGFYDGAIDAAFGRGTRASMSAWQEARNHEPTGVLTTAQRAELFAAYNAVLEGMNLQVVQDNATGIQITLPTGAVAFSEYEPPFAKFDARDAEDLPARVLLISQPGDETRFFGLYEILQTLEIIPPDGERSRDGNRFEIDGLGDDIHSTTVATLENGEIKGYVLVWPTGDEERRSRILNEMRSSFTRIPGVLDPAMASPGEDQAVDLVSGLQVRKPKVSRSGFYVDDRGRVLTTSEVVQECEEITLDGGHVATVTHLDEGLGLAVLTPDELLAPLGVAEFQTGVPRLQSEVAIAGYPYGGILAAPAMTFGTLADIRGLDGEEQVKRLALRARPGDAGGPLFDNGGAVLGMLLPRVESTEHVLPADVSFAADADAILATLETAGVTPRTTDSIGFMAPETLTLRAADMTVLVSCW